MGTAERRGDTTPTRANALRLALMAVALLVVLLLGVVVVSWITSDTGYALEVDKPTGGSLFGRYIRCGTIGSSCRATVAHGEVVELQAQADEDHVFAGYTGDCAPAGRLLMDRPRTCGATFEPRPGFVAARHVLTVTPPSDGTLYSMEADIACGTDGTRCAAEVPHGTAIRLDVSPDAGFDLEQFTGACAQDGTTMMTEPRTCGAVFRRSVQASVPLSTPLSGSAASSPGRIGGQARESGNTAAGSAGSTPTAVIDASAGTAPPEIPAVRLDESPRVVTERAEAPAPVTPPVTGPGAAAGAGLSRSPTEIAHDEITRTLNTYRDAYSRMDVQAMKGMHPSMDVGRFESQFRDLRGVGYTFAGPPEFADLDLRSGTVTAVVGVTIVMDYKAGGKQKPMEHKGTYHLKRVEESARWTIESITYRQ